MTLSAIVAKIVSGFAAVLAGIELALTMLQFIIWMVMMSRQQGDNNGHPTAA